MFGQLPIVSMTAVTLLAGEVSGANARDIWLTATVRMQIGPNPTRRMV